MKRYIKIILTLLVFVFFSFECVNEVYDTSFKNHFSNENETQKESPVKNDIKNIIEDNFKSYKGTLSYGVHFYDDDILITSDNTLEKLKSASLIKLYIFEYVYNLLDKGEINTDDIIGGYKLSYLLENMITVSDNNATNILIDYLTFDKINEFIKLKGYNSTSLKRKMLDTKAQKEGKENYTSVGDILKFLDNLYLNKDDKSKDEMLSVLKRQKVSTKIRKYMPDSIEIANKTGELSDTQNDVGIVFSPYGDFALVFMTNGENSYEAV